MAQWIITSRAILAIAALLPCLSHVNAGTLRVLNTLDKGTGSLRDAINGAKDGDKIVFDSGLAGGTITLTSDQLSIRKNLYIEGPGTGLLTLSGDDTRRVFDIAEGATVTIAGLTIAHGFARAGASDRGAGGGGGILNAGNLTVANAVLSYNLAIGHGGAIANASSAVLYVANTAFIGNQAISRDPFAFAEAGAIYNSNRGSVARVIGSSFMTNRAVGANGGLIRAGDFAIGQSNGGAMHNGLTSILIVEDSTFIGNQALGGDDGSATSDASGNLGSAVGGAIANDENCDPGKLIVSRCTFANNQALGGSSNSGGFSGPAIGSGGGGALYQGGLGTITDSTFIGNQARGGNHNTSGGRGVQVGMGGGGAIKNGFFVCDVKLTVSDCDFVNNEAAGGLGNSGGVFVGAGIGGVLYNFNRVTATLKNSTFTQNAALGGAGAADKGGDGLGGALANLLQSTLTLENCTITRNTAIGASGGPGVPFGFGLGGGAYLASDSSACANSLTTIFANQSSTSNNDIFGVLSICP